MNLTKKKKKKNERKKINGKIVKKICTDNDVSLSNQHKALQIHLRQGSPNFFRSVLDYCEIGGYGPGAN